ncbi:MAG: hypothetical protein GC136_07165 [Alphaproteobacteria bacterium]|nr:hypothetical protein [Alphaproteobacteria bacterium]
MTKVTYKVYAAGELPPSWVRPRQSINGPKPSLAETPIAEIEIDTAAPQKSKITFGVSAEFYQASWDPDNPVKLDRSTVINGNDSAGMNEVITNALTAIDVIQANPYEEHRTMETVLRNSGTEVSYDRRSIRAFMMASSVAPTLVLSACALLQRITEGDSTPLVAALLNGQERVNSGRTLEAAFTTARALSLKTHGSETLRPEEVEALWDQPAAPLAVGGIRMERAM